VQAVSAILSDWQQQMVEWQQSTGSNLSQMKKAAARQQCSVESKRNIEDKLIQK